MEYKHKLRIFENNDTAKLFSIAERLWKKGSFEYYLTNQQLLVLHQIFKNPVLSKFLFKSFIESKVFLNFVEPPKDAKTGDSEQTPAEEKAKESKPEANSTSIPSEKSKDQVNGKVSKDDTNDETNDNEEIINEPTIANGIESARNLALKVRYILYDRAIDLFYDDGDNLDDYEIFGEEETQETETTAVETKKSDEGPRNLDDDYDDDEDEVEDENRNDEGEISKGSEEVVQTGYELDEYGNVILNVPISLAESNTIDNKTLIENFNKIYHSFENDKETLIKRRKLEENDKLLEDSDNQQSNNDLFSINLGAANLSLKHLLRSIDANKEKLNLQDSELRQLIMEVRKNRSKWASDDKIGQEELYEACEKVVMELRNYTEHSTAFLNKVSKREAPNYSQVIKKPMDLNTILKKLKAFQYKSKTEFVDDVMLIWKNCLTYNSDPRHFLRAHAIAMQKKSLTLIPLIPDITVRDRSDVEAENAEESATPQPQHGKTTSKKGKKRTRNGDFKEESPTPQPFGVDTPTSQPTPGPNDSVATVPLNTADQTSTPATTTTPLMKTQTLSAGDNTEMDDDDNGESNEYLNTEDNDKDDFELTNWKNLTSKARADLCIRRAELFNGNRLNAESVAILRDSKKMSKFENYLKDYTSTKRKLFRPSSKNQQEEEPYLIEYDITGGLPSMKYTGLDEDETDLLESKLVDKVLQQGGYASPSEFAAKDGGLNKLYNQSIAEMQEIRKICFKISIIRQMQQQQFLHHSQLKPPEIEEIDDSIDLDPISRLENRDRGNKDLIYSVLKKNVSKITMQSGYESTQLCAIDTLTQIAGNYMDNLARTIKTHLETPSINQKGKQKSILQLSLLHNGIRKPDELYSFVQESVITRHGKLKDLRNKLSDFLKLLLRPAIEMNENQFNDNSEQFLSGDFSNEIGEDFFGFKELGLDKELGMMGNTIPLHLLQSRLANESADDIVKKVHREEFENKPYPRLLDSDIDSQIGLFQSFLKKMLHKTKTFNSKQLKSKKEVTDYMNAATNVTILDDEDYPKKPQKPKLPPTGKITQTKKKITPYTFFLPEEGEEEAVKLEDSQTPLNTLPNNSQLIKEENLFSDDIPLGALPEFNGIEV